MPTLQEMLESDLCLGQEKVASVQPVDGMDKLAMELGLFGDMAKTAEPVEHGKDEGDGKPMGGKKEEEEEGEEKEASAGLDDIYASLFPEDAGLAVVKTAEEKQAASMEEAIGARAHDFYRQQMDNRVEKLAMDMLQGKFAAEATTDGDGSADPTDAVKIPNNRDASKGAINTTPQEQGDLGATNGPADVGAENMQTIKAASAEQQALMGEMFGRGQEMAVAIADQMDKMAAELAEQEKVAEASQLDEESEKLAAVCGAFIERGQFEKLAELGQERHGNPLAYLIPYVEEKVAASGASAAVKRFGEKAMNVAKSMSPGRIAEHAGQAARGTVKASKGAPSNTAVHVSPLTKKERAMEAGVAAAKSVPYLAAAYGTGKGIKALTKKEEK